MHCVPGALTWKPPERGETRLAVPRYGFPRHESRLPRVAEHRLVQRAFGGRTGIPLGHLPRFGRVEPQAEAVTRLAVKGQHARDERLLPGLPAHRMDVDVT